MYTEQELIGLEENLLETYEASLGKSDESGFIVELFKIIRKLNDLQQAK